MAPRPQLPVAYGRVAVDTAALRRILANGRDVGIVQAEEAPGALVAEGQAGVNPGVMWRHFTTSTYTSGDLVVVATREALQNSVDAIHAALRAKQIAPGTGRFDVQWTAGGERATITWCDNGIGMSAEDIVQRFLVLGEQSGKDQSAGSFETRGGFAVAKAVILGISQTFTWSLYTRAFRAEAHGINEPVRVHAAPPHQGTCLSVTDIDADSMENFYMRGLGRTLPAEQRLRIMLAASNLPGITLTVNGRVVEPMFSPRGGSKVPQQLFWGTGTTATIKAYRRPPGDRGGGYYVRLDGLFQFLRSSYVGLPKDIVIDLTTTKRPGESGYPVHVSRDSLIGAAAHALEELLTEVERESESVGRSQDDEVYYPEDDGNPEVRELQSLTALAGADPAFREALQGALGGLADFYTEHYRHRRVEEPVSSAAPRATPEETEGEGATREAPVQDNMLGAVRAAEAASAAEVAEDIAAPVDGGAAAPPRAATPAEVRVAAQAIQDVLRAAATAVAAAGPGVAARLNAAASNEGLQAAVATGAPLDSRDADQIEAGLQLAATAAMGPGGGGIATVVTTQQAAEQLLPAVVPAQARAEQKRRVARRNPLGASVGLRISKTQYDRHKAYRFKKHYGKWLPLLTVWDGTLRLIAGETRMRFALRPGFVLDDKVRGLAEKAPSGVRVIYANPDFLQHAAKAHKARSLAFAAIIHDLACHELAHADGRMGEGHNEAYVAAREDLGAATAPLLPAIAILAERLLGLTDSSRGKIAGQELRRARAETKNLYKMLAHAQAQAKAAQQQYVDDARDIAFATAVAKAMLEPPPGITPADVAAFLTRNRDALRRLLHTR